MSRWGKAGVRLKPDEVRARGFRAASRRQESGRDLANAERLWRAGAVKPYRITAALNLRGLYGPEVDEACGTTEPDVDLWEEGRLYPTWEQLVKLAELTGFPVNYFVHEGPRIDVSASSLRFHVKGYEEGPPPVWEFSNAVVAARLTTVD